MYRSLIIDFSRVLIFSKVSVESLNAHHAELSVGIENYRVLEHFYINDQLLRYLESLIDTIDIYLFSDGALHELPEIRNLINHIFTDIVTAEQTTFKKTDPRAYNALIGILKIQPVRTLFVDDKLKNIAAAKQAGIAGIQYVNNVQLITELRLVLSS